MAFGTTKPPLRSFDIWLWTNNNLAKGISRCHPHHHQDAMDCFNAISDIRQDDGQRQEGQLASCRCVSGIIRTMSDQLTRFHYKLRITRQLLYVATLSSTNGFVFLTAGRAL